VSQFFRAIAANRVDCVRVRSALTYWSSEAAGVIANRLEDFGGVVMFGIPDVSWRSVSDPGHRIEISLNRRRVNNTRPVDDKDAASIVAMLIF